MEDFHMDTGRCLPFLFIPWVSESSITLWACCTSRRQVKKVERKCLCDWDYGSVKAALGRCATGKCLGRKYFGFTFLTLTSHVSSLGVNFPICENSREVGGRMGTGDPQIHFICNNPFTCKHPFMVLLSSFAFSTHFLISFSPLSIKFKTISEYSESPHHNMYCLGFLRKWG